MFEHHIKEEDSKDVGVVGCIVWGGDMDTSKNERRRLDALEMWICRKMEKIAWTDRKTNLEVLEMLGEKQSIVETNVRRKKNHVMRGEGLLREYMEGRMEGKSQVKK